MRLLHIIPSLNKRKGGPAESLTQMIPLLEENGIKNDVVTLDKPGSSYLKNIGFNVISLGPTKNSYGYSNKLTIWLKNNKYTYDAVIVRGIWQYHSFAAWRALHGSGIPYFVFTHGMLDPWFKKKYRLKHLKKWLYWPWAEYRVLKDANAVLFTTEEEKILARQSFWLYSSNEEVVRYGTGGLPKYSKEEMTTIYKSFPQLKTKPYYLYMGRIHEKKGCDLLIRAFANTNINSRAYLVIAGPDDCKAKKDLQKIIVSEGIVDDVIWTGMIASEMKWSALYNAQAFILPSHQENFGISVAESLSAGTPVLISNKVNIWREVQNSNCGIVHNDTLEGTEQLFRDWNQLNVDEKLRMSNNSIICFTEKFHISAAVNSLIEVLNKHVNSEARNIAHAEIIG